jgi:hypothetical protein
MPWEEHHVAPSQFASEEIVRRRTEGSLYLYPFLIRETLDVIKAAAADNSNSMPWLFHARDGG